MMTCDVIKRNIATTFGDRFECRPLSHYLVVNTPFTYPNLDGIQVFVETLPNGEVILSDKGETLRYLASYQIDPEESENKANVLKSVMSSFDTKFTDGIFYKHSKEGNISDDMLSLVNTILRISDFQLLQRAKKPKSDFFRQVEELIKEIAHDKENLEFKKQVEGNSGKRYNATYFIKSANAIIEPLPHPIQAVDWTKIATVFQEFYDLKNKPEAGYTLYAVLDDEDNEWPDEPKVLLSDVAKILLWSRRRQWKDKILKVA
ncbi:MAG: DUF1828 domain-containing protein [Nitrospirae bacterium]|nr:MAG: DUF1828 domain-containing protein [Nitrospirota bacterium]